MKIAIGNDHAGTEYKFAIVEYLTSQGIEIINHGTNEESSVDYPDFVHPVAKDVDSENADFGILICGSGNGVAMTANKYKNIEINNKQAIQKQVYEGIINIGQNPSQNL